MFGHLVSLLRPIQFRGKPRLLGPLVPRSGSRTARVFDYEADLDLSDYIGRSIYLGSFEREETREVRRFLRPGMTFLDVGANIGYFTLLAASRVGPSGRVIAVEPSPVAFKRLAATVARNRIPTVTCHPMGLSDADGSTLLYLPDDALGNHSPTMVAQESGTPVEVPVRRLDDCLDEWGVESVDLMKIDVEGHEPRVFAGASRSLASGRIKAILCELNDVWLRRSGSSGRELYEALIGHGFEDRTAGASGPPADGTLVNRFFVRKG